MISPRIMHRMPIKVRFNECDMYGHVNHAQYLTFLEIARVAWLEENNIPLDSLFRRDIYLVIISININYIRSAVFNDELEIQTVVLKETKTGATFRQTILYKNQIITTAEIKWACTNKEGKPVRLADDLKKIMH